MPEPAWHFVFAAVLLSRAHSVSFNRQLDSIVHCRDFLSCYGWNMDAVYCCIVDPFFKTFLLLIGVNDALHW